jgi:hypothetical protein
VAGLGGEDLRQGTGFGLARPDYRAGIGQSEVSDLGVAEVLREQVVVQEHVGWLHVLVNQALLMGRLAQPTAIDNALPPCCRRLPRMAMGGRYPYGMLDLRADFSDK